ncbi:lysozyme inhibitor LprI family protein [uncultured Cohaesibacter sp.]|uniref:lysozyme inhibitor LprI family protein n=1 Tax=uncultured Cohaesibacter sp. TaxID=1002546 RepID=UPI0029C689FF|nr:lysozyme inhibitor LprI family protein [uncultured Cohaesibacter sp.]
MHFTKLVSTAAILFSLISVSFSTSFAKGEEQETYIPLEVLKLCIAADQLEFALNVLGTAGLGKLLFKKVAKKEKNKKIRELSLDLSHGEIFSPERCELLAKAVHDWMYEEYGEYGEFEKDLESCPKLISKPEYNGRDLRKIPEIEFCLDRSYDTWKKNRRKNKAVSNKLPVFSAYQVKSTASKMKDSGELRSCLSDNSDTNADMMNCVSQETKRYDLVLNQVYKCLRANLSKAEFIQLRNKQRRWIKQKKKSCVIDPHGGTMAISSYHSCRLEETKSKAIELYLQAKGYQCSQDVGQDFRHRLNAALNKPSGSRKETSAKPRKDTSLAQQVFFSRVRRPIGGYAETTVQFLNNGKFVMSIGRNHSDIPSHAFSVGFARIEGRYTVSGNKISMTLTRGDIPPNINRTSNGSLNGNRLSIFGIRLKRAQ